MSLSSNTAAAGGLSAASTAWTSSVSSGAASGFSGSGGSGCADGCCPTGPRLNIAAVLNQGNMRGELSGDNCFSVELGEDKICGAVWSETEFISSNIRTPITSALGIAPDGNKLLVDGVDRDDELTGIIFGVDAERMAQKNPNIDVLYPTQLLATAYRSTDFAAPEADEQLIDLVKSSDPSNMVSIYPEQALSLLLLHWYHKTKHLKQSSTAGASSSAGGAKKKKTKKNNLVTLVLPGYCGMAERINAQKGVRAAGLELRHIFSRGLAAVAAVLTHSAQSTAFYNSLQAWMQRRDCGSSGCDTKGCDSGDCSAAVGSADPIVLYVHTSAKGVEVSIIRCERPRIAASHVDHIPDSNHGKASRTGPSNLMGFDRLVCLASGGGAFENMALGSASSEEWNKESYIRNVIVAQLRVAHITDTRMVAAILLSGSGSAKELRNVYQPSSTFRCDSDDDYHIIDMPAEQSDIVEASRDAQAAAVPKLKVDWAYLASCPVTMSADGEAARGGAVLSAAEMESCKQYIDSEDGDSTLAYALSIGEDVVSSDVGYLLLESSKSSTSNAAVTTIFRAGTSIHKTYLGPPVTHRDSVKTSLVPKVKFDSGPVNILGYHRSAYEKGYPKVFIVERRIGAVGEKPIWRPSCPAICPLNRKGKDELATRCAIEFTLNETTGTVVAENAQEESVQAVVEFRSQVFRVVLVMMLVVALVAGWYLYGVYTKQVEYQTNADWLTDFYTKNAPEKLEKDNELIQKTLKRYGKDMFLLWRKLEKAYNVKWKPPSTILDSEQTL